MENEYYYKNELEKLFDNFLVKENTDSELLWIAPELPRLMADAAFSVLKSSVISQQFKEENEA